MVDSFLAEALLLCAWTPRLSLGQGGRVGSLDILCRESNRNQGCVVLLGRFEYPSGGDRIIEVAGLQASSGGGSAGHGLLML